MIPPKFAVTGTGRCGTGYTASVLRQTGIRCGHENWWTVVPERVVSALDGDSSWRACDSIERGEWSGPVVHIVRNPVNVVRSFTELGFDRDNVGVFEREPELAELPPLEMCVEWWVRWNRRCAAVADLTVQVESFGDRLEEIAEVIGHRLEPNKLLRVSTNANSKRRHRRKVQLDETQVWRLLDGRAAEFGYTP